MLRYNHSVRGFNFKTRNVSNIDYCDFSLENECEHSDKSSEQEYIVALFIMLYKVVLTFEYVDEMPKCDHSNESY